MKTSLILSLLLIPAIAYGATLTTVGPNNGSGGIFMDLTAGSSSLLITGFDTYFSNSLPPGDPIAIAVYTRPGSYAGFTSDSGGWSLLGSGSATSAGDGTVLTGILLPSSIAIPAGGTIAVYLHSTSVNAGIRYNGTGGLPPQTLWNDAYLSLFSDTARTGSTPFDGSLFAPRTFAGNVHYDVTGSAIPEPSTFALLAFGIAGIALHRRRRVKATARSEESR